MVNGARAFGGLERAVVDRQVLGLQVRRAFDGVVLVDVLDDFLDLLRRVAELDGDAAPLLYGILEKPEAS